MVAIRNVCKFASTLESKLLITVGKKRCSMQHDFQNTWKNEDHGIVVLISRDPRCHGLTSSTADYNRS